MNDEKELWIYTNGNYEVQLHQNHTHIVIATGSISTDGVTGTGKNKPPYVAIYMYKRVG